MGEVYYTERIGELVIPQSLRGKLWVSLYHWSVNSGFHKLIPKANVNEKYLIQTNHQSRHFPVWKTQQQAFYWSFLVVIHMNAMLKGKLMLLKHSPSLKIPVFVLSISYLKLTETLASALRLTKSSIFSLTVITSTVYRLYFIESSISNVLKCSPDHLAEKYHGSYQYFKSTAQFWLLLMEILFRFPRQMWNYHLKFCLNYLLQQYYR